MKEKKILVLEEQDITDWIRSKVDKDLLPSDTIIIETLIPERVSNPYANVGASMPFELTITYRVKIKT